jgi:hypothetical protein
MKFVVRTVLITIVCVGFLNCRKSAIPCIVGKWNIVNDSSSLAGNAILQGGDSNYIGMASDYYDFRVNGNLYIKEGATLDTAIYTMVSANQVKITFFVFDGVSFGPTGATRGTYIMTNHTTHTLSLTLSGLTPEGEEFEMINLKK